MPNAAGGVCALLIRRLILHPCRSMTSTLHLRRWTETTGAGFLAEPRLLRPAPQLPRPSWGEPLHYTFGADRANAREAGAAVTFRRDGADPRHAAGRRY